MRDPERIEPFLAAFAEVWKRNPDMRFGQLFMNLSRDGKGFADTWEWEDDRWLALFEEYPSDEEIVAEMEARKNKAAEMADAGDYEGAIRHLLGVDDGA